MNFTKTHLPGVYLIEPTPYTDHRGLLRRHYCYKELRQEGIEFNIRQTNISENKLVYTLRGFHFQLPPHQEIKQISCVRGVIYGIILDLRPESSTYRQWFSYQLDGENRLSVLVPEGCANAYMTLAPDTWILYYHSEYYNVGYEMGIRYDDAQFNFSWPKEPAIISDKDAGYPVFEEGVLVNEFRHR
jgi:dTDP-4-dehydrorhamnose 3,5-epimerase